MIKNFIKSSSIITCKNKFLKVKEVRLLWNSHNNSKLKDEDMVSLLSTIFGKVSIESGILGWKNKAFKNITDKMIH